MRYKDINKFIFDIEIYPNYFCVVLKELDKNNILIIDNRNFKDKKNSFYKIIENNFLISYGGYSFDDKVLNFLLSLKNKNIQMKNVYPIIKKLNTGSDEINCILDKDIFSFDIYKEYNCNVGIKGFAYNLGETIVEHSGNFNKAIFNEQIPIITDYCKNDVLVTEDLYKMLISEKDILSEKEILISKILKKDINSLTKSDLLKYLKYTNNELIRIFLSFEKINQKIPKKTANKNYIEKFDRYNSFFDNKYKNNGIKKYIAILELNENYIYNILKYLEDKEKNRLKLIDLSKISELSNDVKTNIYNIISSSTSIIWKNNDINYLIKLKNILFKKIKIYINKYSGRIIKIVDNKIFIDGIETKVNINNLVKEINLFFRENLQINLKLKAKYPENFIKLNRKENSISYKMENTIYSTGLFKQNIFENPNKHKWLAEVIKLHYWENYSIEEAINYIFKNTPETLFMFYSANRPANRCNKNGNLLNSMHLSSGKKYRVYYSKTGNFKGVDGKNMTSEEFKANSAKIKYKNNFGLGDVNNQYFKMRYIEIPINMFNEYDDFDLESYILYAKNFIENDEKNNGTT